MMDDKNKIILDLQANVKALMDRSIEGWRRVKTLEAEKQHLEKWVGDLQSGMYINCVYCGHQYPKGTPGVMQEILYEHIGKCPKHPLRKAEDRIKALEDDLARMELEKIPLVEVEEPPEQSWIVTEKQF